jgi:hypothetical protein
VDPATFSSIATSALAARLVQASAHHGAWNLELDTSPCLSLMRLLIGLCLSLPEIFPYGRGGPDDGGLDTNDVDTYKLSAKEWMKWFLLQAWRLNRSCIFLMLNYFIWRESIEKSYNSLSFKKSTIDKLVGNGGDVSLLEKA